LVIDLDGGYTAPAKYKDAEFINLSLSETKFRTVTDTFDFRAKDAKAKIKRGYNDAASKKNEILEFFK